MVTPRYTIKKVLSADAEDVVTDLHATCWPGRSDTYWDEDAEWWVVEDHTGGSVAFGGLRTSKDELGAYLCRSGVHPLVRGQGLQRKLIKARETWARKQGLKFLTTDTVFGNYHSANNLIASGFRMFNPISPWGADDSSYWRKDFA